MIVCSNNLCKNWKSIGHFMVLVERGLDPSKQKKIQCPLCNHHAVLLVKKKKRKIK